MPATLACALLTPAQPLLKKGSIIAAKPVLTAILRDLLVVVTRAVLVTAKFLAGSSGYACACLSRIQEPGLWHEGNSHLLFFHRDRVPP